MRYRSAKLRAYELQRQRGARARRRALGLCTFCEEAVVVGLRVCGYHEGLRIKWKADYDERKRRAAE